MRVVWRILQSRGAQWTALRAAPFLALLVSLPSLAFAAELRLPSVGQRLKHLCSGALSLLTLLSVAYAQERLVVLEANTSVGTAPQRRAWTDAVRRIAQDALPPDIQVVRRAELDALTSPGSTTLTDCDADCAVITGRRLGVDLVVTVRVHRQSERWWARVALTRTHDGRLLQQGTAQAPQIETALEAATREALTTISPAPMGGAIRAQPAHREGPPTLLLTGPRPMHIEVDGQYVGRTPVWVPTPRRFVQVRASEDGYQPQVLMVDTGPISSTLVIALTTTTGVVDVALPRTPDRIHMRIDGVRQPRSASFRLSPGIHRFEFETRCMTFPSIDVKVVLDKRVRIAPVGHWRCPRVRLLADRAVAVKMAGDWYQTPQTTPRLAPGEYVLRIGRDAQTRHTVTIPASSEVVDVEVPVPPRGGDVSYSYRHHLGHLVALRGWTHAQRLHRTRWGLHVGLGLGVESNPDAGTFEEPPDQLVKGLFIGLSLGIPVNDWLEWTITIEAAAGQADETFGIAGMQTGLRLNMPDVAIECGWGVAAHGLVDGWGDAHGVRLAFSVTE